MSQESKFRVEMPPATPVLPVQLLENDKFCFRCHKGIAEQQDQMYDSLKEQGW